MRFSSSKGSQGARKGGKGAPRLGGIAGLPRFLQAPTRTPTPPRFQPLPTNDHAEHEARSIAAAPVDERTSPTAVQSDATSRRVSTQIAQRAGAGRSLPQEAQSGAQTLGVDAGQVRLHDDSSAARFADSLGANAVTVGRDIFFAQGRYAPHTDAGSELLRHELTHVAQQGGEPQAIQRDIHEPNMNVPLGIFMVDMTTSGPGMNVNLLFDPDPTGPYSTQIGMTQVINVTDQGTGAGHKAGQPVDWSTITDSNSITTANPAGTVGTEGGRMEAMTTGDGLARKGAYVDALYDPAVHPRSSNVPSSYEEPDAVNPTPGGYGDYGWLRSPTDTQPATLIDNPNMSFDVDFDFQTFARGTDNQVLYGGVEWGFQIRSGAVLNDYAVPLAGATPELTEAMGRFQGYFSHEDVIVYFDTDSALASGSELAKLNDAHEYMDKYPDTRIEVTGYADQRGTTGYNAGLSLQRADEVVAALLSQGIDPARIDTATGAGESTAFAPGSPVADAGSLKANRRVVVHFVRTAEAPINEP
ncbi:MAG: OmpA/MotB domain protein [Rhodocyclales bacterium]|nr:OmpA/MotB domain protein [Rhodocyclales bacterium]